MALENQEKAYQLAVSKRNKLLEQAKTLHISTGNSKVADIDWGVAPFIREKGIFYIYVSELGGHVRSILRKNPILYSVVEDEVFAQNIWARIRLKFTAETMEIHRDKREFEIICEKIAERHGNVMNVIREFSDFHLFAIKPVSGVIVTGFGSAYNVSGVDLKLSEKPLSNE